MPSKRLFGQQGDAVAYLVYHLAQLFDPFKKYFQLGFFFLKKTITVFKQNDFFLP